MSEKNENTKNFLRISIAILLAVLVNCGLNLLVTKVLKIPLLFMDTVGTITIAFIFGGFPGMICAVISQTALGLVNHYFSPIAYFYVIPVLGAIGIVCIFRNSLKKSKYIYTKLVILVIISISMAFVVSILGGLVNTANSLYSTKHNIKPDTSPQTMILQADMIRIGFSQFTSNILSRIPGNLIERPITTFMAYGICVLNNLLREKNN